MKLLGKIYLMIVCSIGSFLHAEAYKKDVTLEFKAAYFQPTHCIFKDIYGGGGIFGPEVTFNIFGPVYGFASYDFFIKKGRSLGLNTFTKVSFQALALGFKLKSCATDYVRPYAGLGFQPVFLSTKNCSPYVIQKTGKWGFGGIAKLGVDVDLPHNIVLDIFSDYSFVTVRPARCTHSSVGYIQQTKGNLSGFIFGVGLGYRFN